MPAPAMLTAATIASCFDTLKAAIPAAVIRLVIGSKTVEGLCAVQNTEQQIGAAGMGTGYSGEVYLKKSELPTTPALASGDVVQQIVGSQRINKRVRPVGEIGGTILAVTLQEEFA